MIILRHRKFQAGADVVTFQERILGQNLFPTGPVGEELQHILHAQTIPANARPAAAFSSLDGDTR